MKDSFEINKDIDSIFERIRLIFHIENKYKIDTLNEAQIEEHLIKPILLELGWNFEVQDKLQNHKAKPDYQLYRTENLKLDKFIKSSIICEAKTPNNIEKGVNQIKEYLMKNDSQIGFLTSGLEWRFYIFDKENDKFLIAYKSNLFEIIQTENKAEFKSFIDYFGNNSTVKLPPRQTNYYKELQEKVNKLLVENQFCYDTVVPYCQELSNYYSLINHINNHIICEANIFQGFLYLKKEDSQIIEQGEKLLLLCEKYNRAYDIQIMVIRVLTDFYRNTNEKKNIERAIELIKKYIIIQKLLMKPLVDAHFNLAITYCQLNDYDEGEKFMKLALVEAKSLNMEKFVQQILSGLARIQKETAKFKEEIETIEQIQKGDLENLDHDEIEIMDVEKRVAKWKSEIFERLDTIYNIELSPNILEDVNGIRPLLSIMNTQFLYSLTAIPTNRSEKSFNNFVEPSLKSLMYNFWGQANYEWIIMGLRFFKNKDNTVKVRVNSLEQIRHYLKSLLIYNDTILFYWDGEIITNKEPLACFMEIPSDAYKKYPKKTLVMYGDDNLYGISIYGYYNLLPDYVLDFILGEGRILFEKGYFIIVPMILGGYVPHKNQYFINRLMDKYIIPPPVINLGNLNSTQYFELPYFHNIELHEINYLLEENESSLLKLRNAISEYRISFEQGKVQEHINLLSSKIKYEIAEINNFVKNAKKQNQITFESSGLDFIDLESQIDSFKDNLFKINEKLASDFLAIIKESPFSLFWKTEKIGKTWNINKTILFENDGLNNSPEWINHWLQGTSTSYQMMISDKNENSFKRANIVTSNTLIDTSDPNNFVFINLSKSTEKNE